MLSLSVLSARLPLFASERPNILFIIADDASRDSMGVYGSTYVETPNFDRIAREGVLFTQAYNCNPKCAPARACLLTGRYSWQLESACNHNPFLSNKWEFYPYLLEKAIESSARVFLQDDALAGRRTPHSALLPASGCHAVRQNLTHSSYSASASR